MIRWLAGSQKYLLASPGRMGPVREAFFWLLWNAKVLLSGAAVPPPGRRVVVGALMTQRRGLTNGATLLLLGFLSDRSPQHTDWPTDTQSDWHTEWVAEPAHISLLGGRFNEHIFGSEWRRTSVPPPPARFLPPGNPRRTNSLRGKQV